MDVTSFLDRTQAKVLATRKVTLRITTRIIAWGSWIYAIPLGFVFAASPFGMALGNLNILIGWLAGRVADAFASDPTAADWAHAVPRAIWAVVVLAIIGDLIYDWNPNRKAVYGTALAPSLALNMNGHIGAWITAQVKDFSEYAAHKSGDLLGWTSILLATFVGTTILVVLAHRVLKDVRKAEGHRSRLDDPMTAGRPAMSRPGG
jgi:hypothetical protein